MVKSIRQSLVSSNKICSSSFSRFQKITSNLIKDVIYAIKYHIIGLKEHQRHTAVSGIAY